MKIERTKDMSNVENYIFHRVFFYSLLLNYKEFVHETSHINPSKYDSTFLTKITMFEKNRGMRLWIGTSTFKIIIESMSAT